MQKKKKKEKRKKKEKKERTKEGSITPIAVRQMFVSNGFIGI